jgi:predicted nuclease with TOPRIM domain
MALTNAERQAALKTRREETARMLAEQNAALLAENSELRGELDSMREKVHRLELAALRAQIKAQAPAKTAPVKKATVKKTQR